MARTRVSCFALAIVLLPSRPAAADLLISEQTTGKAGGRTSQGIRTTYIKGRRMRIELVQGAQSIVTLYDLPDGTSADLDGRKTRAQLHDAAARNATRGQTELYRAISAKGVPHLVDMTIGIKGTGALAGMVRKIVSGARTSTVTNIAVAPLADTLFAVPDGWKRDHQ